MYTDLFVPFLDSPSGEQLVGKEAFGNSIGQVEQAFSSLNLNMYTCQEMDVLYKMHTGVRTWL